MNEFINYLGLLDKSILARYKTLEKNIKNRSNSYYDSYLDLFECTLKVLLVKNNIEFDNSKTFGMLLKCNDIIEYLKGIGVEEQLYNKILDYTKKANDHKHKQEKNVTSDAIVNQMRTYYIFVSRYLTNYLSIDMNEFDDNYYIQIFGENEKLHNTLKNKMEETLKIANELANENNEIKEALEDYKNKYNNKEVEYADLEEENNALQDRINIIQKIISLNSKNLEDKFDSLNQKLDDLNKKIDENKSVRYVDVRQKQDAERNALKMFLLDSTAYYLWTGKDTDFKHDKKKTLIFLFITTIVAIVSTILSIFAYEIYSTFTLFENIYGICLIICLIKTIMSKKKIKDYVLASYSTSLYELAKEGFYVNSMNEKKAFKILRRISYVAVGLNVICLPILCKNLFLVVVTIIFELLYLILTIVSALITKDFYSMYGPLMIFTNKKSKLSISYDSKSKKYYMDEEFSKKFSSII